MDFSNVKNFMDRLTDWLIPGNSIVIYKDNEKVFDYSSGYCDLDEKRKMKGDELFRIYSCTKVATVTAAMQLFEKGYFLMSTPLYDFIPEFRNMKMRDENGNAVDTKNPIAMHHLFTMSAGLRYSYPETLKKAYEKFNNNVPTVEFAKMIAQNEVLDFNPGMRFQYSYCHDILAAVVEVISGKRFCDYMRENIFLPLGMNETYFHLPETLEQRLATQYVYRVTETDLVKLQTMPVEETGVLEKRDGNEIVYGSRYDSGGGGIITSMNDYALLMNALANNGLGKTGERVLSPASVELMHTPQLTKEQFSTCGWSNMQGYGYGLGVRTLVDKMAGTGALSNIGEFGWGGAAGASVFVDTKARLAVSYAHHMLNPQEAYYQPRLRNVIYSSLLS